jgi:outer membrane biosynthesis protein TonB
MKAMLRNGRTLDVGGFKAVDAGVVLTADREREEVVGFLPYDQLTVIVPDEVAESWAAEERSGRPARRGGPAASGVPERRMQQAHQQRPPQGAPNPPAQQPLQQQPPEQPPQQQPPEQPPQQQPPQQRPPGEVTFPESNRTGPGAGDPRADSQ